MFMHGAVWHGVRKEGGSSHATACISKETQNAHILHDFNSSSCGLFSSEPPGKQQSLKRIRAIVQQRKIGSDHLSCHFQGSGAEKSRTCVISKECTSSPKVAVNPKNRAKLA